MGRLLAVGGAGVVVEAGARSTSPTAAALHARWGREVTVPAMVMLPTLPIVWAYNQLAEKDIAALRRSGMDLHLFEQPMAAIYRLPAGTQRHLRRCPRVKDKGAVQEMVSLFDLVTLPLHRDCWRNASPLPVDVETWLRLARNVAGVLELLEVLEDDAGDLEARRCLVDYLPALEDDLTALVSGRPAEAGGTALPALLTEQQADAIRARCQAVVEAGQRRSSLDKQCTAAAIGLGAWPPLASLQLLGPLDGTGATVALGDLWKHFTGTVEGGKGLDAASALVRRAAALDPLLAGIDIDGVLSVWREEILARARLGEAPVIVGVKTRLRGPTANLVASGYRMIPAPNVDRTTSADPFVVLVPEIVADRLRAQHEMGIAWFGPGGERPEATAELVATLWGSGPMEDPRACYEAALALRATAAS